jgi:RNA polymerase sigma factor for flagellar operon FliA
MTLNSRGNSVAILERSETTSEVPAIERTGQLGHAERQAQIEEHAPLVKWVVSRMVVNSTGELDRDDLISSGTIGLIQAVDRFDPAQGVPFRTYAVSRIRGAIIDALRASDRLPRSVRQKAKRFAAAQHELSADGAQPSHAQLAAAMGMTPKEYDEMRVNCTWQTVSLNELMDRPNSDGDSDAFREIASDSDTGDFSQRLEEKETLEALTQAVAALPARELMLVSLYYKDGMTMREICQILDVSESRISQLHRRALERLRAHMQADRAA